MAPVSGEKAFGDVEATLEKAGRVEELIRLYEARAREVPKPEEAGHLLSRAADLARTRLGNPVRAEELFRRALVYAPNAREPLNGVRQIAEGRADFALLAETLERMALTTTGSAAAAHYLAAAELYETKLGRRHRAVLCCQLATRVAPSEPLGYRRARRLLMADEHSSAAFDSLEREREAVGEAALLDEYVAFAEGLLLSPHDHGLATKALVRALAIDDKNPRAHQVQKDLAKLEYVWREKVKQLKAQSLEERDRRAAARLSLQAARLYAFYEPTAVAKAKEFIDRCFALWPAMPAALNLLETVAHKSGDMRAALTVFSKLAAETRDKEAQVDLELRIGGILLTQLNDGAEAAAAFERAAKLNPARSDAAELACEMLIQVGRGADGVKLLERHVTTLKDKSAQVAMRVTLADVALRVLKDEALERTHLEAAIAVDPHHAPVAFRLASMLVAAGELERAWPLLEVAVSAPKPVSERVALCEAVSLLCEDAGDHPRAFAALAFALPFDPGKQSLLMALTAAARRAQLQQPLALALRRAIQVAPPAAELPLWTALGQLLQAMERPIEAHEAWNEVLARQPDSVDAHDAVTAIRKQLAELPTDPRAKLEAEAKKLEAASVDPAAAAAVYRKILELDPHSVTTLQKLFTASMGLGSWAEAASVAEQLVALADGPEARQSWRAQLAQLYAERLDRRDAAADLYISLVEEGVTTATIIGGLERLAALGIRQTEVARLLAPHYAQNGDVQRQVASLLVLLSSAKELADKKGLLALLADTSEHRLLDGRAAFDFRLRGVALDPADASFRVEAARLARVLGAQQELARILTTQAAEVADAATARAMWLDAAALADEVKAVADAAAALQAAALKTPGDRLILSRLSDLWLRHQRWLEADGALRLLAPLREGPERVEVWLQVAQVNREAKRPREVATALSEALKAGGDEAQLLPQLANALEEAWQLRELVDVQAKLVALYEQQGEKDKAAAVGVSRARLLETALGDKAEAIRRYAEVLTQRPSDADSISALEQLLNDETHRGAAARALLPALTHANDHRRQTAMWAVIAETSKDSGERVQALKTAADLHANSLRQPELAFVSLVTALKEAPGDAALRTATRNAAEAADTLDSYVEALEDIIEHGVGPAELALRLELAEVLEKKVDDVPGAITQLTSALKIDGKHLEALRALHRLHRAREAWPEVVVFTEQLAALEQDLETKGALDREAAIVAEQKLNDLERASANWRRVASRDAMAKDAASALDRLSTQLDRPAELAFALSLRCTQEAGTPGGLELQFRLAQVRQLRLNDVHGAVELYRQILSADPAHEGTRAALEALVRQPVPEAAEAMALLDPVLAAGSDHQRRLALREARLANISTPQEGAVLRREQRVILERDLGRPEAAFMQALKSFAEGVDRDELQPELERLATQTGSLAELAEIYESAGENAVDLAAKLRWLRRAAVIHQEQGETDDAIRVWKALLEAQADDGQALQALQTLFEQSQNARSLSDVYLKHAQLAADPAQKLDLLMKAGAAFDTAGNAEQGIATYVEAAALGNSVEAFQALDRLYAHEHRWGEQAEVLTRLARALTDPDARAAAWNKRAGVLVRLERQDEALEAYKEALSAVPSELHAVAGLEALLTDEEVRVGAAKVLEPVYRAASDFKKLVDVLDAMVPTTDGDARRAMLTELATLREATGQKALALTTRLRAFAERPDDEDAREALERLAADLGAFEELTSAYQDALERGVSEALTVELWRRLAVISTERLERFDLAAQAWNEVLARRAEDRPALNALARLYTRTSDVKALAAVMQRQVAVEPDVDAQLNLLFELAALADDALSDKRLAAQCYQAILERRPDDQNALKLLGRVLTELERWPELAALLVREAALAESQHHEEAALELLVRLGRLRLSRLGDPRAALTTFQEVLRRRPAHAGAVGALEEMARSENPLKGEAASTLEPVFAEEGEHLKLVQMLEAQVGAEPLPVERAGLLRKMADVYAQQMDNPEMAFVAASRALREDPNEAKNLELVLTLSSKSDVMDEAIALLGEVAPKASNDAARAGAYRALARLQMQNDESSEAVESWKRVLEVAPTDAEALEQAGKLLALGGRGAELLEVIKRQLTVEEDLGRRCALLLQLATVQEGQGDPASAFTSLRRVLELKPDEVTALERLDTLCEAQQRWPELADVITRRAKLLPPEEQSPLVFRLAVVRETRLLDKAGAIELFSWLLSQNATHAGALQRMEAIVQKEPQNQPAVEVLLRAYRQGDPAKLAQLIEVRAGVSPDAVERKTLLMELASIRDAQSEPELAYLALYRAFKEDPNDAALRKKLEAAAQAASSWDELAAAYEAELGRITEPADSAQVCFTLGQILEQQLKEPERAVLFYERARALHPGIAGKALAALDRLYGQLDQPMEQADALEAMADGATEAADKVALAFRLGQLVTERLDDMNRAASAFEKVLAADAKHLPSLRSLETIYEQAKSNDKLYKVLETQATLVQGPERERVLTKMALTASEGIGDVDNSITLYRELLSKNPRNEQAFEALNVLLERASRFEELRELLVAKLQTTVDPRELVRLNERLGKVLFEKLNKPEDAVAAFKAALDRDARNQISLFALRDIFEALGRKDDLVIVLRRLIPLQEDPSGVKQIRIRLAEIIAGSPRREESLDAGRRALEVEPHTIPELDRLYAVFFQLKSWPDVVRVLEARAQVFLNLEERESAVQSMFMLADMWRTAAGKPESAAAALGRVLEIDPANKQAYDQLLELHTKVNDWRNYTLVMDRFLPHLLTPEEKVGSLLTMAKVQEQKLGQKDAAFLQYCRALQIDATDDLVREQVERLADETGSHEELAAVYEEVADSLPKGPLAEHMFLTLARVQDTKLDEPEAAEASLRKILEFDPTNERALERLSSMFNRRGQNREYIVSLEQKLEAAPSIEKRKEVLREIARVFDEQLNDAGEAERALQRAIDLEPDTGTLSILAELQRRQENYAGVASALLRMRDLVATPEERSKLQVDVAQVYERDLQDDEAAVAGFRQALEFDPGNPVALESLERLYTRLDRPAELLAVYERQIELAQDYRERVKVLFKSASIWEERYQNFANADSCIDAALQIDPANLQAIKTLERLRKAQARWEELVGVLERHFQLLIDPAEKAEICVEMGDVFHQQMKVVDRAVTAYHQALDVSPSCRPAMHALGKLYERSGNWPFALEMLEREAQAVGADPEAVELWFRAGKINEDMLSDMTAAKRCYQEALRIDPSYVPAIRTLKGLFEGEKDWDSYEKALLDEAEQTEDPEERAKAFLEVARFYESREDRDAATKAYESALKLIPDSLEAARPLADIYLSTEKWERCEAMLAIVTAKLSQKVAQAPDDIELTKELCRRYYRLGYVCEKNARRDKALSSYEKAYQLDSTYLAVLEGYGNLLVQ
ncbi:MAG: tetratricopeptide repeat protein, partial [Archangium sp.]|nr:tetratricopeptide repeat protein [Archangium sp.]